MARIEFITRGNGDARELAPGLSLCVFASGEQGSRGSRRVR